MPLFTDAGWLDLISGYLIKSTIILVLAIGLSLVLRRRSAGLSSLVLALFLIGLLFLPFFSIMTSGWETGLLPAWDVGHAPRPAQAGGGDYGIHALRIPETGRRIDPGAFGPEPAAHDAGKSSSRFRIGISPLLGFLVLGMWGLGSILLFSRMVLGLSGASRLAREGRNMDDSNWRKLLNRFLQAVSLRRKISLLSHDGVQVPLTWGFLKPIVMMPAHSRFWSEGQRSTALFHEMSHVKRGDFPIMLAAGISRAVFWFNPLSWCVFRMMKREQEKACDELVLKAGIKPSIYAENLLLIRNSIAGSWNPPVTALGGVGKSNLNVRLIAILKRRFNLEEVKMRTKIFLGILAVVSISFVGMARPDRAGETVASDAVPAQPDMKIPEVSGSAETILPDQEKEKKKQEERKKAEEKEKASKEETVYVWTAKKGEKDVLEIVIDEKGEKKAIRLKAPYAIKIKKTPEKTLVLTSPRVTVKKGEEGEWTVETGKIHVHRIGDAGAVIHVKKHDEDGVKVIELTSPVEVRVAHLPEHVSVALESGEGEMKEAVILTEDKPRRAVKLVLDDEEYRKRIEKIQEIVEKLKQAELDPAEKERNLERIEEVLAELKERPSGLRHAVDWNPKESDWSEGGDIYVISEKDRPVIIRMAQDQGEFSIHFQEEFKPEQREAYDRFIRILKERIPEGCEVVSEIDEEKNIIRIGITGGEDAKKSAALLKKLIQELKEDLEKLKK